MEEAERGQVAARRLLGWYEVHQRALPWRSAPSPYRVWISEVMLQQTRVATALPYFARWMARFPDVEALARAPLEEVLEVWSGLGYYQRARTLHRAAQELVASRGGQLPEDLEGLLALPGVGRYTAGAIASIAYELPAPIVDGNVIRVLCRIFGLEGDPRASPLHERLWALAEALIPPGRARDFNQSLMELGALVCSPRGPSCGACPVAEVCVARQQGRAEELPQRKPKRAPRPVLWGAAVLERGQGEWLMAQRPAEGLFGGLWELPTAEVGESPDDPSAARACGEALRERLRALGFVVEVGEALRPVVHLLTHLRLTFLPVRVRVVGEVAATAPAPTQWVSASQVEGLALSSAMRRVIQEALLQPSLW